jgi:hypothetical protein
LTVESMALSAAKVKKPCNRLIRKVLHSARDWIR